MWPLSQHVSKSPKVHLCICFKPSVWTSNWAYNCGEFFQVLLRLARELAHICKMSNQALTMGMENNLKAAACWVFLGAGSSTVAGQRFAAPVSLRCSFSEFEGQSNQWTFISLVVFPVIKIESSFTLKKCRQYSLKRGEKLQPGWTSCHKRVLLSLGGRCIAPCHHFCAWCHTVLRTHSVGAD